MDVRTYAASKEVSVQAVYNQLKRHKELFEGHISKEKGVTQLDDEAIAALDKIIKPDIKPVGVLDAESTAQIKRLSEENAELYRRNAELYQKLDAAKDQIISLTAQNSRLTVQAEQQALKIEQNGLSAQEATARIQQAEERAASAEKRVAALEQEKSDAQAKASEKRWWQFWK